MRLGGGGGGGASILFFLCSFSLLLIIDYKLGISSTILKDSPNKALHN